MTQDCARSESRIRIAFDQSLELQSLASSIRSATAGAIGEEIAGEMDRRRLCVKWFACVLGDESEKDGG